MSQSRVHLQCPSSSWGIAVDARGTLEKRCRGQKCRTRSGDAVIHDFDLATGSFRTRPEQEPNRAKEQHHGRYPDPRHR